ncbi:MAG: hypothetical protein V3S50_06105 [Acidobacteriota bacterium]
MKHFIFRQYGWLASASIVFSVSVVLFVRPEGSWQLLLTWLGGTFSFVYLVQKQALEELRLFKELFGEFNHRYDELNEHLNRIAARDSNEKLDPADCDHLNDYFNLCAEEYLFYKRRFIYPEVWQSWFNGMKWFYRKQRIREYWKSELASESYYGLRFD